MAGVSRSSHPEPGREVGTAMKARPRKVEEGLWDQKEVFSKPRGPPPWEKEGCWRHQGHRRAAPKSLS